MSLTRTKTDLIGTPASPHSIAAGASYSGTALDLTATAGTFEAELGGQVILGSAPSAGPTVTWSYSLDATNYIDEPSSQTLPTTASTTFTVGPYTPPMSAKNVKCTITNNDGASVAITAWVQGNVLASSAL